MNGEMQTTSTVRYQALNYLPKINRTKLYICFALTIHLLSAKCFSQIPVEVFAGHKRATFDIMFFKFFKDNTHFLKHKDIVNIYYDQNNVIGESIPRLSKYNFLLNKYVSFFINEEKVKNRDLREFILSRIKSEDIIKVLPAGNIPANNAYLIDAKAPIS